MPSNQPYDPSFSYDLDNGYLMNPGTGQIFDSKTNTVYASPEELAVYAQSGAQQAQGSGSGQSQGGGADLGNMASTAGNAYSAYTLGSSSAPAVTGGMTAGQTMSALGMGGSAAGSGAVGGATAVGSSAAPVGSAMGGGTMMADGTVAAMSANGTTAAPAGAGLGAYAGPIAIAAATYMAGKNYEAQRKASGGALSSDDWSKVNHMFGDPAWGNKWGQDMQRKLDHLPGSPVFLLNTLFGASRQKQEAGARKVGRNALQDLGYMNPDSRSRYNLADGSQFDIRDYKAQTGNDAYNINFDGTENADGISLLNAITSGVLGDKKRKGSDVKDGKTSSDLTGELYNAAMSNGDFKNNVRSMLEKAGGHSSLYNGIAEQWKENRIDAAKRDSLFAALDKEYGIANPTGQRWENGAGLKDSTMKRNNEQLAKAAENANKIPKSPMATTKPLPVAPVAATPIVDRNGGRPAMPINMGDARNAMYQVGVDGPAPTYRPGASVNPNFKNAQYTIPKANLPRKPVDQKKPNMAMNPGAQNAIRQRLEQNVNKIPKKR